MNGKQSKRLRREAEAETTGWPGVGYDAGRYNDCRPRHLELITRCTRARYKAKKRSFNGASRRIGK